LNNGAVVVHRILQHYSLACHGASDCHNGISCTRSKKDKKAFVAVRCSGWMVQQNKKKTFFLKAKQKDKLSNLLQMCLQLFVHHWRMEVINLYLKQQSNGSGSGHH